MKTILFTALMLFPSVVLAAIDISMQGLVHWVVVMIIFGVVIGLLFLLVAKAPFIPGEWKSWINYFIWFIVIIFVINVLLSMAGSPLFNFR